MVMLAAEGSCTWIMGWWKKSRALLFSLGDDGSSAKLGSKAMAYALTRVRTVKDFLRAQPTKRWDIASKMMENMGYHVGLGVAGGEC